MPFVDAAGTRLHYREQGTGPVALMVHGFPLDSTMWLDQMDRLADRRRCVAVDLRGFGLSAPTTAEALSMERHADDLAAFLDALGVSSVDLIGLSMGGYVALAFAQLHGVRMRSLALIDTRADADTEEGRAARDATARSVLSEGRLALARRMSSALLAPSATPEVRARILTMIEATAYETILAALVGMRDRPDRVSILGRISVPCAIIVGEHDAITPVIAAEAMHAAIAHAGLHIIEGAGHMSPMEAPDAVAKILDNLLGSA